MDLQSLQDYRNWVGKSAGQVFHDVLHAGGWEYVFPTSVPRWASRVRNYFNENPRRLTLLSDERSAGLLKSAQTALSGDARAKPAPPADAPGKSLFDSITDKLSGAIKDTFAGAKNSIAVKGALSGEVYEDEGGRVWFQMAPGGTIYHFGQAPGVAPLESAWFTVLGQRAVPIFKLVSPDGSGGSRECCLTNPRVVPHYVPTRAGAVKTMVGQAAVGDQGVAVDLNGRHITDPIYQATYNYSETVVKGFRAHELRDVIPHSPAVDFYVNPPSFPPMRARLFPEADPSGKPLAEQG